MGVLLPQPEQNWEECSALDGSVVLRVRFKPMPPCESTLAADGDVSDFLCSRRAALARGTDQAISV